MILACSTGLSRRTHEERAQDCFGRSGPTFVDDSAVLNGENSRSEVQNVREESTARSSSWQPPCSRPAVDRSWERSSLPHARSAYPDMMELLEDRVATWQMPPAARA
jgi:hypothetical protein